MKIQSVISHLFLKRKNVFFALFFAFFITSSFLVFAETPVATGVDGTKVDLTKAPPASPTSAVGVVSAPPATSKSSEKSALECVSNPGKCLDDALKTVAVFVFSTEAFLANAAAILFVWILNPNSFDIIMNNSAVYDIWKITRDTMNMLFILILLFSAFATIYQIDKYKYNKVLWTVILMALLVNFSWPIARLVIDFFNSMMYFFIGSLFNTTGNDVMGGFLGSSQLEAVFLPKRAASDWPQIFLAIIVMFIFMCTLLVLSLMMLARLVALPVLVMFSPIGFAGMAAPFTKSYASKWWDKLFQYASYGPVAVFMVLVGVRVMQSTREALGKSISATAGPMSTSGPMGSEQLAAVVQFAIPIILMWIAITSAEKMSTSISGMSVKFGTNMSKWAGRQPWRGIKAGANATGVPGGVKAAWKDRKAWWTGAAFSAKNATRRQESAEDHIARGLAGGSAGWSNAKDAAKEKRIAAEQERLKKLGNVSTAHNQLKNGNADQKAAAALYLADKKAFNDATELNNALKSVGGDLSSASKILDGASDSVLEESGALVNVLNTLKDNKLHHMQGAAVAKFTKDGLGASVTDYENIVKSFDDGSAVGSSGEAANKKRIKELTKKYNKQLASEGRSKIHFEHELANNGGNRDKAYEEVFNKMSMDNIVKQDAAFLKDTQFMDYLKNTKAKEKEARKQLIGAANRYGTSADVTAAWTAHDIKVG